MSIKSEVPMDKTSTAGNIISWVFGLAVLIVGLINTFWGNDTIFGICIALCAFIFFPPVNAIFKRMTGFAIPLLAKIVLGIFIIWASLGVGELLAKIDMMMKGM